MSASDGRRRDRRLLAALLVATLAMLLAPAGVIPVADAQPRTSPQSASSSPNKSKPHQTRVPKPKAAKHKSTPPKPHKPNSHGPKPHKPRPRALPVLPRAQLDNPWAQRLRFAQRRALVTELERRATKARPRHHARPSKDRPTWPDRRHRNRVHRPATALGAPAGAASCPSSLNTQPVTGNFSQQPEHAASLLIRSGRTDPYYLVARIQGPGTAATESCSSVSLEANLVATEPTASWLMYTGPHTVVQATAYGSTSRNPPATWTKYYRTALWDDTGGWDQNPLFDNVAAGTTLAKAFLAGTGTIEVWDTLDWLQTTGGCQQCDLSGYTIESATLQETNGGLPASDLSGATIRNVTFGPGYSLDGANLRGARFENVTFGSGANLAGADLTGATLVNVTMPSAVLTGANLSDAAFVGTNAITAPQLAGAKLDGISLSAGTSISGALIGKAAASTKCTTAADADLTVGAFTVASVTPCLETPSFAGSMIKPSAVPLSLWTSVSWNNAIPVFDGSTQAYLKGANLTGLQMQGASFWGSVADLSGVNLTKAALDGTAFTNATLTGATLQGASATRASFAGANLSSAKLDQPQGMITTFDYASFMRATLDNATFNGSLIRAANFTQASAHGSTDFGNVKAAAAIFDRAHILGNPLAFRGAAFGPSDSFTKPVSFVSAVLGGNKNASTGISFESADLAGANFAQSQCIGCAFSNGTDLTGVDFQESYLEGATFVSTTLTDATFANSQTSSGNGTWTFALGLTESASGAYAVSYGPTSFAGSASADVAFCPTGERPDPTTGCLTKMDGHPTVPTPDCSAAGLDACPTKVTTVVGTSGVAGAPTTHVRQPQAVAVAPNGSVFFADAANHVVVQVESGGQGVPIAGNGQSGDSGDGGPALDAELESPTGLAIASDGTTLYVSDAGSNRIRKLTRVVDTGTGTVSYTISAVAGSGEECANLQSTCGDGSDPQQAQFSEPAALWVDPVDNVYVADTEADRVRVIIAGGGVGTVQSGLSGPAGIAGDQLGQLYVSNTDAATVLRLGRNGSSTRVLGTGTAGYNGTYTADPLNPSVKDQPKLGTLAQTNRPMGLATNLANQVFVAEAGNGIVRRISTSGYLSITAGKTNSSDTATDTSTNPDGLYSNQTGFKTPVGIAVTADGQFVVTDAGYYRVRGFGPYPPS